MKISYTFSRESFSYISGNRNPKKVFTLQEMEVSYISGGTFNAPKTNICYTSSKTVMNKFF